MEGKAVINEQDAARFMFVGTRGKSFSGDIAIDDISVKTCLITPLCNDKDFMCLTTPKFVLLYILLRVVLVVRILMIS